MKVPSFNEFISEAVETPKLVIITDEPEQAKTFHTADRLQQEAKKLGWKYYLYKLVQVEAVYQFCDQFLLIYQQYFLML